MNTSRLLKVTTPSIGIVTACTVCRIKGHIHNKKIDLKPKIKFVSIDMRNSILHTFMDPFPLSF